jgi:hypothetical protein
MTTATVVMVQDVDERTFRQLEQELGWHTLVRARVPESS